jgi:hypothetical protein
MTMSASFLKFFCAGMSDNQFSEHRHDLPGAFVRVQIVTADELETALER